MCKLPRGGRRLSILDVENTILTGRIVERQVERPWGERKYLIRGRPLEGEDAMLVVENVPVVSSPSCGESYLTAETLHEIERIKLHRRSLAKSRPVATVSFG